MTLKQLGLVLMEMSESADREADRMFRVLGGKNVPLFLGLSHVLKDGAEACGSEEGSCCLKRASAAIDATALRYFNAGYVVDGIDIIEALDHVGLKIVEK